MAAQRKDHENQGEDTVASDNREELLTLDQAVQFLGTSKPTMHRLLRQGDIKGLKVGRQWRFRKADLVAHMERRPPSVAVTATDDLDAELRFFATKLLGTEVSTLPSSDDEEKVVQLVNAILIVAIQSKASDIHLDPRRQDMLLRNRIDGVLNDIRVLPGSLHASIVGRLKMMSGMDITEKRLPQEGRTHLKYKGKDFDLRVTSLPTAFGEAITARVLDSSSVLINNDLLGFFPEDWTKLQNLLHQPNGFLLITGPTGSGKTTVLYSCLKEIATRQKKTMSIEDPVEYQLPEVTQTHLNRKAGLTYVTAIRAMMRSDPDIIMIGEITELETAQLAHHAALTGHLVLSTMHTTSAAGTIVRLLDMGMEPFLMTQALLGITAQRLIRCVCPDCKAAAEVSEAMLNRVRPLAEAGGYRIPNDTTFMSGKGCSKCRNTGYRRRTGIYEILKWSPDLAEATLRRASEKELTEIAVAGGMKTILADGVRKAVEGITTLDEVLRVVTLPL